MARFTVTIPKDVADWVKKSAKEEGISQSLFVSTMLTYGMASMQRDIRLMDMEDELSSSERR